MGAGEIEAWGGGIERIFEACRKGGAPEPALRFEANGLWIEFPFSPDFLGVIRGTPVKTPVSAEKAESQPESRPESLEIRVLRLLQANPLSKAELTRGLGLMGVSGQLNKVIRRLLAEQHIAYTRPDTPNSLLQKHRMTDAGILYLESNQQGVRTP